MSRVTTKVTSTLSCLILVIALTACVDRIDSEMQFVLDCADGRIEKVEQMLPNLESVDYRSLKGDTPLTAAAANGHFDIVRMLVDSGANISFANEYGNTAMELAQENGYLSIQRYLGAASK